VGIVHDRCRRFDLLGLFCLRKIMTKWTLAALLLGTLALFAAQTPKATPVEIELLTHTEIYDAIHNHGKTTVLIFNGGTEQRGPHAVLGGHTFIARDVASKIAQKLGNALVAPVLPFSITTVDGKMPGGVTLTADLFKRVNEAVVDSMVKNGFRDLILMGDHGTGQKELGELAAVLDRKYASQGVHVYFCGDVYEKSEKEFDAYMKSRGLPPSTHGGIPDTSELLALQPAPTVWVRDSYKTTAGDPVPPAGQPPDPKVPRLNNGITGDPRLSTAELGRMFMDIRIRNAVAQIQMMITAKRKSAR
jgi:creatinine amidohydrolase/Fe(II)-dependent formamide hydrolase-like protein